MDLYSRAGGRTAKSSQKEGVFGPTLTSIAINGSFPPLHKNIMIKNIINILKFNTMLS